MTMVRIKIAGFNTLFQTIILNFNPMSIYFTKKNITLI